MILYVIILELCMLLSFPSLLVVPPVYVVPCDHLPTICRQPRAHSNDPVCDHSRVVHVAVLSVPPCSPSCVCSSMWPSANNMSSSKSTPAPVGSAVHFKTVYARVGMCPLVYLSLSSPAYRMLWSHYRCFCCMYPIALLNTLSARSVLSLTK